MKLAPEKSCGDSTGAFLFLATLTICEAVVLVMSKLSGLGVT